MADHAREKEQTIDHPQSSLSADAAALIAEVEKRLKAGPSFSALCDPECYGRCRVCPGDWVTDVVTDVRRLLDLVRALQQERDALKAGWLPIESAPKDGTHVLVFDDGCIVVSAWVTDGPAAGWWDNGFMLPMPTHWMPLPAPPAEGTP